MFSLGRVLIPLLTFLLLDERLYLHQYAGFCIIILTSIALSIKNLKLPKINLAFYLMLLSSSIRSVFAVLEKYTIDADGNWINMVIYPAIFGTVIPFAFFLSPPLGRDIKHHFAAFRQKFGAFISMEFLGFAASSVMFFVLPYISAVTKTSISATMPIFILITGLVLDKFFHIRINETLNRRDILKKMILFVFMIWGVFWVVGG